MTSSPHQERLTTRQVVALLGVPERRVLFWRAQGRGPAFEKGEDGRVTYDLAGVLAWGAQRPWRRGPSKRTRVASETA